ncbi:MAG: beta-lactamase domain protein [Rhodospirillales bacterium]|jgi:hydroxyacylglutathione hydrolase|nr:beta-lactamase domain protein [Rhodospirillales bacterium]
MTLALLDAAHDDIQLVTGGVFPSNAYICTAPIPGGCFLVDPGINEPEIDRQLTMRGLRPGYVLCTHGHFDHAGGAAYFQEKYGCPVLLHAADMRTLRSSNFLLMAIKIPRRITQPQVTEIDGASFTLRVGDVPVRFRHAPGHTPGSCVIEYGNAVFAGDTLYRRGIGLSRLPGEDVDTLRASILDLWDTLPNHRMIYPGHGSAATFGEIRAGNEALLEFLRMPTASAKEA